jgi:tellurite methyltransferase
MAEESANPYDARYSQNGLYWGPRPSILCFEVLKNLFPSKSFALLDIGCGEGRNAVFFARNGYNVTAFDTSAKGVEKVIQAAIGETLSIQAFQADLNEFRLDKKYDVLFSTGALHYLKPQLRDGIISHYKEYTQTGGLNAFSVLIQKPFIEKAPDAEPTANLWRSGEILTCYHDWEVLFFEETIFDCNSSGIAHRHAVNRILARKK